MSPRSQDIKQSGLIGFLAQPDAPTTGGVVILPTIFGVNAFVRGYAETLARAGLAAAVWDLYEGLPLTTDYEESKSRARKLSDAGTQAKVEKWIDHMLNDLQAHIGRRDRLLSWRPLCAHDRRAGHADQGLRRGLPVDRQPAPAQPGAGRSRARRRHPLPRERRPTRARSCRQR